MNSIRIEFNNIQRFNPYWSSYICFCEIIKKFKLSGSKLNKYFNLLVEKGDYAKSDKRAILRFLGTLNLK